HEHCIRFFLERHPDPRDLHSFPTRRSSDLRQLAAEPRLHVERGERLHGGNLQRRYQPGLLRRSDDAVARLLGRQRRGAPPRRLGDRKSTRLNSSHVKISYAVFCLKKKKKTT